MIASIIPLNVIERGKNAKGLDFSDGEEMEGEVEVDKQVDANELLEVLQSNENIPIKILHEEPPIESNTVSEKAISLVSISNDDDINKNAQFLEDISKVFDQYETFVKFTASRNILGNAYKIARRELKN